MILLPLVGTAGLGISLAGTGLMEQILVLASFIVALGIAGGVMDLWYQVQATELSEPKDRSMAMASVGLGWPLCLLVAPLLLGWMADTKGFQFTFVVSGIFFLVAATASYLYPRSSKNKAVR